MGKTSTVSRRRYFKQFGTAGLGSLALMNSTVQAQANRIESSAFRYRFRTFGPDEVIRIGMIGTDGHTATITGDIPSMENVKLVAYARYDNTNVKIPSDVKVYKEYEEMLDREQLDIVGICLPYYLNATASIAAAQRKIHIMTEKPVATTLDDLNRLLKAVTANRVRLTTLLNMRMEPQYQAIREAITLGKIGEPILATAQKSYKFGKNRPDFYKDPQMYGGTIPWVGIHPIDYIHFTTSLDYTGVAAFQGNKDHPDYPGCQDYAGILLSLSNGGATVINLDFLRPETAPTHGDDRLRVIGSEGVLEIKDGGQRIELISSASEAVDLQLPERKSFLADFVAELRGQGDHVLAPEEPFEMTRVALLAHQSAEQKRIIVL